MPFLDKYLARGRDRELLQLDRKYRYDNPGRMWRIPGTKAFSRTGLVLTFCLGRLLFGFRGTPAFCAS